MRTDGQTDKTKLIVPFLNIAQVPKNHFNSFKKFYVEARKENPPKIVGSQSGNLKDCFVLECDNMHCSK